MNKDFLENIIRENKQAFDTEEAPLFLWEDIEQKLKARKRKQWTRSLSVAASILLVFASSIFLIQNKNATKKPSEDVIINQEVLTAQAQFSSLIELKKSEINQYKNAQPDLVKELNAQLADLQKNYNQLVPQLKDENKKEIIVQALIENLQLQLEILNRSLEIVQNLKNGNYEKETIQL